MTGFRNLLVHDYAEIDNLRVVGHLDDLADIDAIVRAVSQWVQQGSG